MGRKVLIILGHPRRESLCGALADAYAEGAMGAGAQVERLSLGELEFDPLRPGGYSHEPELEPALLAAQASIRSADELVFVHPNWWGGIPALLKGFIDRVFLPGFAFRYHEGKPLPEGLLKGKRARLLVTMDSPPWFYRWFTRQPGHRMLRTAVLHFCGVKPVTIHNFGPVRGSSPERRARWIEQARGLGGKP